MNRVIDWYGCYDESWKDILAPEAMAHPAKFAFGLIERILEHGLDAGWWQLGDVLGDPFGGVATGGVVAAYKGLQWVGVELEPRFVELAQRNIEKHRRTWEALGDPVPVIVQGDSRRFHEIVQAQAIITSPPYNKPFSQDHNGSKGGQRSNGTAPSSVPGAFTTYGRTEGQIEGLKNGSVDAVVTSPPYENTNIATDPEAEMRRLQAKAGNGELGPENERLAKRGKLNPNSNANWQGYGSTEGQIGSLFARTETHVETYWQAMATVYQSCFLALRSGGVIAVVVKDYIQNKRRVPLCDQTHSLLEKIGFVPVERIRAWLVTETEEASLFGGKIVTKKERKSFFRRLSEKKGAPRIDWEEVLILRRPQ